MRRFLCALCASVVTPLLHEDAYRHEQLSHVTLRVFSGMYEKT